MRGHWISGTRKLNKHYQSGEGGEGVRVIVKENRFAPTFPGNYDGNNWTKRSTLSGYTQQFIDGSLQDGWIWEALATQTRYGIGYPFNATEQDLKDSCDRIAKPYSRPGAWSFLNPTLHGLKIWVLCSATYSENGQTKTNGLQPFKITINSNDYKPERFMTVEASNDPNIFDISFSDPSSVNYDADITKIKNFFARLKRINVDVPVYRYDNGSWIEIASRGGANPMNMTLGDQLIFYATDDARIIPEYGMYYTTVTGKAILPEVEVTL